MENCWTRLCDHIQLITGLCVRCTEAFSFYKEDGGALDHALISCGTTHETQLDSPNTQPRNTYVCSDASPKVIHVPRYRRGQIPSPHAFGYCTGHISPRHLDICCSRQTFLGSTSPPSLRRLDPRLSLRFRHNTEYGENSPGGKGTTGLLSSMPRKHSSPPRKQLSRLKSKADGLSAETTVCSKPKVSWNKYAPTSIKSRLLGSRDTISFF